MTLPKSFCCKKSWSLLTGSKIISITYMIFTAAVIGCLIFISVNEAIFRSLSKMQPTDYLLIGKSLFPQAAYIESTSFESNNLPYSSGVTKKKSEKSNATNFILNKIRNTNNETNILVYKSNKNEAGSGASINGSNHSKVSTTSKKDTVDKIKTLTIIPSTATPKEIEIMSEATIATSNSVMKSSISSTFETEEVSSVTTQLSDKKKTGTLNLHSSGCLTDSPAGTLSTSKIDELQAAKETTISMSSSAPNGTENHDGNSKEIIPILKSIKIRGSSGKKKKIRSKTTKMNNNENEDLKFESNNLDYSSSAIAKKNKSGKTAKSAEIVREGKNSSTTASVNYSTVLSTQIKNDNHTADKTTASTTPIHTKTTKEMSQESSSAIEIKSDLVIRTSASNSAVTTGEGNREKTKTIEERKLDGDSVSTSLVSISSVDTSLSTNTINKMDEYQTTTSTIKASTQNELATSLGSTIAPHITEIALHSTTSPDSTKTTQPSTKKENSNSDPVFGTDKTRTTIDGRNIGKKTTTKKNRKGKADVYMFGRRRRFAANYPTRIKHNNHKDNSDLFNNILISALVLHGIYFGACILLMIGISKRSSGFVAPWLLAEFLRQLAVLAIWMLLCYHTVDILNKDTEDAKFAIPFCAAILIVIVLAFYFWLVICSLFKELHAKKYEIRPEKKDEDAMDSKANP